MANTTMGQQVPLSLKPGVGAYQALSNANQFVIWGNGTVAQAQPANAAAPVAAKTSSLLYLIGVILLLVLFKFSVEHEKTGMEFGFLGISVYNFIAGGIMAFLFIVLFKVIINKYPVPGLTDLVNVV